MKNPSKFNSRNQAYARSKKIWVCLECGAWNYNQGKIKAKDRRCCDCKRPGTLQHFDSTLEATRYAMLVLLQKQGDIKNLKMQVVYPHVVNGIKVFTYRADFVYYDKNDFAHIEDVKPKAKEALDPVFKLKQKCIEAQYGFKIEIVH